MSIGKLNVYRQTGREDETYAAPYQCLKCGSSWYGGVSRDASSPGDYRPKFRFCPCCGTRFEKELPPSEKSVVREDLRHKAAWANYEWLGRQKIAYRIECRAFYEDSKWRLEHGYVPCDPSGVLRAWKLRIHQGSWFGEDVRVVAVTPSREVVVFGPVRLNPDTNRDDYGDDS